MIIGDATGKVIPAALEMAAARSYVRTAALESLSPGKVLSKANEFLCQGMPENMFVTCLYAIIDPAAGSIVFANAGHNLPCHLSTAGVTELMARGMPLGLMPGLEYEEAQASICKGDSLLFYSDGLVEAHNASSEMFGVPRLKQLLSDFSDDSPIIDRLLERWQGFRGAEREQEDDMSIVALHYITEAETIITRQTGISVSITPPVRNRNLIPAQSG